MLVKKLISPYLWTCSLLIYSAIACSDQNNVTGDNQSETASLDQLATGNGAYRCDGSHLDKKARYTDGTSTGGLKVVYGKGSTTESQKALAKSFGAVPREIGLVIESIKNAQILVTSDAATLCRDALAQNIAEGAGQPPATNSCWIADQNGLRMVFDPSPQALSETVVRTFTYTFTEHLIPIFEKVQGPLGEFVRLWTVRQTTLAQAYLKDVKALGLLDAAASPDAKDVNVLKNPVTAEAFDSYFCSAASQKVMKTQFPQTWKAFVGP